MQGRLEPGDQNIIGSTPVDAVALARLFNEKSGGYIEFDTRDPAAVISAFNRCIGLPPADPEILMGSSLVPVQVPVPGTTLTVQSYVTDDSVTADIANRIALHNADVAVFQARAERLMQELALMLGVRT
jgi:hypothetical protein